MHIICCYLHVNNFDVSWLLSLQAAFQTKEAYYKTIGYAEEDGKIESTDSYVDRLSAYMKLYGALVQVSYSDICRIYPQEIFNASVADTLMYLTAFWKIGVLIWVIALFRF